MEEKAGVPSTVDAGKQFADRIRRGVFRPCARFVCRDHLVDGRGCQNGTSSSSPRSSAFRSDREYTYRPAAPVPCGATILPDKHVVGEPEDRAFSARLASEE
jgi:hypothetical protein